MFKMRIDLFTHFGAAFFYLLIGFRFCIWRSEFSALKLKAVL